MISLKTTLSCVFLLIFTFHLHAQTFEEVRGNQGESDFLSDVTETPEGNFLAVGRVASNHLFYGLFTPEGDTLWTNDELTQGRFQKVFPAGEGYHLFGRRNGNGFMMHIDAEGNSIDMESFELNYSSYLVDVSPFPSGGYALLFQYDSANDLEYADPDGELLLINENGEIESQEILNLNDSCWIAYKNVLVTSTEELLLHYHYSCDTWEDNTVFRKLNSEFSTAWEITAKPTWSSGLNQSLVEDMNGDFYFAYGSVEVGQIDGEIGCTIGKIAADGTLLFLNTLIYDIAPGWGDCNVLSIDITDEGNLLICGNTNAFYQSGHGGAAFIALLSTDAELLWSKHYYDYDDSTALDYFSTAKQTSTGGYVAAGWVGIGEWAQVNDYQQYLVLTDDTGCLDTYPVTGSVLQDADTDCENNTEDEGLIGIEVQAKKGLDVYETTFTDVNGNYEFALPIGDYTLSLDVPSNTEFCNNDIEIDEDYFDDPESIDFLIDLSTSIENIDEDESIIEVYPNPAREELFIHSKDENVAFEFTLTDLRGHVVKTDKYQNSQEKISLPTLLPGIYFWRVQTDNDVNTIGKILIQD